MKKTGFTLIELLAVIVILALILAIAVPSVSGVVTNARKSAFSEDTQMVLKDIEYKKMADSSFDATTLNKDNIDDILKISNDNYELVSVTTAGSVTTIVLKGVNKWNGSVSYGTKGNISVVDTSVFEQAYPSITITGSNPINVSVGGTYTDAGATASDVTDGNITGSIITTGTVNASVIGTYYKVYSVTNSRSKTITGTRVVNVVDNVLPVITMLGSTPVSVNQGSSYTDAGATASDNVDGNITGSINTVSTVNTNVAGTYTVTYNVSDAAGNAATPVVRTVNVVNSTEYVDSEGVNKPKLATGMTAVKWDGSNWITVTSPDTDTSWYNYANKEWANAKTADGSMWVWIPRYIYKIPTANWHTNTAGTINIQFTKDTNDNWNSAVIGNIDTGTTSNASNNKWTNHPAFTFGAAELTGIWVAKFEASNSSNNIKIINGTPSWYGLSVGDIFNKTIGMETNNLYGWGTTGSGIDTHLIKSIEWGAVAYLTNSTYGRNAIIIGNDSGSCTTGGGSGNAYVTNVTQSTTSNVYGVYDMSGGCDDIVAAYVNNGNSNIATNGSSITAANAKYRDVYPITTDSEANNYSNTINLKGDAIYETSSGICWNCTWHAESVYIPYSSYPWLLRGGDNSIIDPDVFYIARCSGALSPYSSFRVVLAVKSGI